MTEKEQYYIENNPVLMDLIERLDCVVIEGKEAIIKRKISDRVDSWFQEFSTPEKDHQIDVNNN